MKVFYQKDTHVTITFNSTELKQALGILNALAEYFKADFLYHVAKDLKDDLFPALKKPQLPHVLYHRICEKCCTEIDTRTNNWVKINEVYKHETCPILKDQRPI